ncbi:AKR_HP2_G0023530.mRNA.1.CDS.1 [Saccharomyces cerevisiae]|nr:AKR_HP2_G0023530.mRNA.1.CDS.1 [Saccharomyces cerevisiae]CAI6472923.1 AKR_HP2_G0023530.mRNA.1.CDS.1 [Saccharomyces cerevisiae]
MFQNIFPPLNPAENFFEFYQTIDIPEVEISRNLKRLYKAKIIADPNRVAMNLHRKKIFLLWSRSRLRRLSTESEIEDDWLS